MRPSIAKALQYECRILVAKSLFLYWVLFQAPIIRQNTSAWRQHDVSIRISPAACREYDVSIRQHPSAYVSESQHTSAYVYILLTVSSMTYADVCWRVLTCAYVCIRMHKYADVCWRMPTQKIWVKWGEQLAEQEFQWWIGLGVQFESLCRPHVH